MLGGINDRLEQADELVELVRRENVPCKFNLIPFNPFTQSDLRKPEREQVLAFCRRLNEAGIVTTVRKTRGTTSTLRAASSRARCATAPAAPSALHSRRPRPRLFCWRPAAGSSLPPGRARVLRVRGAQDTEHQNTPGRKRHGPRNV